MLQTREDESEIVLGNKQLAGIFLIVAVLLGIAFTAGYVVRGKTNVKNNLSTDTENPPPLVRPADSEESAVDRTHRAGQTHTVGSDENPLGRPQSGAKGQEKISASIAPLGLGERRKGGASDADETATKSRAPNRKIQASSEEASADYSPHRGSRYLQVAAVSKDEAETLADVLHRKGFRAHAVAKPGSTKIYRVIIGPVHDAGDLSATRDSLRKTGFREVIVQTY